MDYTLKNRDSPEPTSGHGKVLPMDTVSQLKADHRRIQRLFYRLDDPWPTRELTERVQAVCDQLTIYLTIKEEIFYPGVSRVSCTAAQWRQLDESIVEHFSLRIIMETLDGQAPGDPLFTAKVRTMKRQFAQHVEGEERRLFPEIKQLPLNDLSQQLHERRVELMQESHRHNYSAF